jgi:putative PIN family toxin of toxin-antitoxin system
MSVRAVLDTNVVVSALLFGGGRPGQVRAAWQQGVFVPLASANTINELVRVLAYPKFRLAPDERDELLADYLPWIEAVRVPDPAPRVPACRDPADAMFLHLAVAGRAACLVTGDADLLALVGKGEPCRVLSVEAFCREVLGG